MKLTLEQVPSSLDPTTPSYIVRQDGVMCIYTTRREEAENFFEALKRRDKFVEHKILAEYEQSDSDR